MGGDKNKGKGSGSGSSSKSKHKKQKGADQPDPPPPESGDPSWPEEGGEPFYPEQPRFVPEPDEQGGGSSSSTTHYTFETNPPSLNISLADVHGDPWAAVTMKDASATCPVIGRRAVDDMNHSFELLDQQDTVPTSEGDVLVYGALELLWNEFNDNRELLRYGTSLFYVTDADLSPYDVIVHPRFGKKNKHK